jgi:DNA-binding beta-propeller fold protein YncE
VVVAPGGAVYVADTGNNRIVKYSSQGVRLAVWGGYGTGPGKMYWPYAVALDSSRNVYVADSRNNRIEEFTSAGVLITAWGVEGTDPGYLHFPRGIAVDAAGNVYVGDTANSRVQVFAPVAAAGVAAALTVGGAAAQAVGGGRQALVFTLSAAASVQVVVLNLAGRTVRTVAGSWPGRAGVNTLAWDGRSDRGLPVPNGTYLVRVVARTAGGQQAATAAACVVAR